MWYCVERWGIVVECGKMKGFELLYFLLTLDWAHYIGYRNMEYLAL